MNKSESVTELIASLVKFNKEVTMIAKDAKNPFFKNNYATLDQIIGQVRPILASHGLVIMQDVSGGGDGIVTVKTLLLHDSGEYMETTGTTLKLAKNDPQGTGAGVTYARRYDLSAALNLNTGEDDDGNSVSGNTQQNKSYKKTTSKPKTLSMSQKNEIDKKSKEFAKLRNQTVEKVMSALNISDLNLITENYAEKSIATLDGWLKKASEDNVS